MISTPLLIGLLVASPQAPDLQSELREIDETRALPFAPALPVDPEAEGDRDGARATGGARPLRQGEAPKPAGTVAGARRGSHGTARCD